MLTIRTEQLAVFDKTARAAFESEMLKHLPAFYPKHSEALGEKGLRQVVSLGLQHAKKYGLTSRGPVRTYLECMFLLGSQFDRDPQYPWATDILIDCQYSDQMKRAVALTNKTTDYVNKVFGAEHEFLLKAVRQMAALSADTSGGSSPLSESSLIDYLSQFFPEKCAYLGPAALRKFSEWAIQTAKRFGLSTTKSVTCFARVVFILGHGFAADPQFPWAALDVKNLAKGGPESSIEEVCKRAQEYLQKALC